MSPNHKKKILAVFGNVAYMGQERINIYLLDQLQQTGELECLLAVNDRGVQWFVQPHLESAQLPFRKMRFCWNIRKDWRPRIWWLHLTDIIKSNLDFYRIWRDWRPDFIHCGNDFQLMTILPVVSIIDTPIIFLLGDEPTCRYALERWLWRKLATRVTRFVCISRFIYDCLLKVSEVSAKTQITPNVPPERIPGFTHPVTLPPEDPEIFTVIYMGQLTAFKGVDLLVNAAIRFLKNRPDARFILAGPTEPAQHQHLAHELITRVACLNLSGQIIFTGMVENISLALALAHIHICPSLCSEALSLVVPEAKQARLPSIIFPSGGLPELVTHQVDGYLCPGKSVDDILAGLEYYYDLPDWGRAQGEAAFHSLPRLRLTKEQFLSAWLETYGLTPEPSRPSTGLDV